MMAGIQRRGAFNGVVFGIEVRPAMWSLYRTGWAIIVWFGPAGLAVKFGRGEKPYRRLVAANGGREPSGSGS